MKALTRHFFTLFLHLGGVGLLRLGILDSSFLFLPFGNDLLLVALTMRDPAKMPYYAAMASVGSVLGVLLADLVIRKGGEQGLKKHISPARLEFVKGKMKAHAGWVLGFACLMPPPFPFTPFVLASVALQYPRKKLLGIVGIARAVRFTVDGWMAIRFGRGILRLWRAPSVRLVIAAIVVVCIGGSVYSVWKWMRGSIGHRHPSPEIQGNPAESR